jgi:CubicO group peptidase (beta-lactamase class C family)
MKLHFISREEFYLYIKSFIELHFPCAGQFSSILKANFKKMKIIIPIALISCMLVLPCGKGRDGETAVSDPDDFRWEYSKPEDQGFSSSGLDKLVKELSFRGTKKLLIIRNDKIVCEWFAPGSEDSVSKHYSASLAKALVGGISLLAAMDDGYIHPEEPACNLIPSWKKHPVKSKITVRHLATHTSGMEDAEADEAELKEILEKGLHPHMDIRGWKGMFWKQKPDPFSVSRDSAAILSVPGLRYAYSNPGIGMLTYAVTASLKNSPHSDVRTYLRERIYEPIGIKGSEYSIGYGKTFDVDGLQLVPSWGGGNFTANAVARIGRLMLRKGNWQGKQLIDKSLVEQAIKHNGTGLPASGNDGKSPEENKRSAGNPIPATTLGWYCNFDGVWKYLPRDAFAGAGAGNQLLFVVPSLNLIVVRFGGNLYNDKEGEGFWLGAVKYLFNPVVEAIEAPPYPRSDLIKNVRFDPPETVIRMAEGSDNWPVTWADDDNLYSAYGDGKGFAPFTDIKLSLGIAQIKGTPPDLKGTNIRSASGERVGEGKNGPKASGILMTSGTLYMIARNLNNAQLGWSKDYGKNWEWADWQFGEGFGAPVFLNYGKNYKDAADKYVYIYSPDSDNAYDACDRMVLARVPADKIKDWKEYEYFAGLKGNKKPLWSEDPGKREAVFVNPGKCYRSGITYNKGLKRYLWCQIIQRSDGEALQGPRFKGGLGIFEAPDPWGPWKTAYYDTDWDMGPGESGSIPSKWMSSDGKTCYYLFSGDDCLSVRKLIIE